MGVYIIILISAKHIDCEYSLELPCWGGSKEYPHSLFWAEIWTIPVSYLKTLVFGSEIFYTFN